MAYSRSELLAIRETICISEVRMITVAWTNISVCASTHRDVRDGANTHIHGHVSYTRRPRARGQMAPNIDNLTIVPLVKSSNIKVKTLKCALINCQSMCNKTSRINCYIVDEQIDVAILTKAWLSGCEMD